MAFRHMSWEQRARRLRRRKQRRVAAAAVTLAGGQLAWMVTRGASPVEALEANRSTSLQSGCAEVTQSCPNFFDIPGGVTDVAVSDDGRTVAFITSEALLAADTDPQAAQAQFRRDVYVRGPGGLRLVTDDLHPGDSALQFWTVGDEVAISGDGRYVTWTMTDGQTVILFRPPAVPVATGAQDNDFDSDVFVAALDADADGVLDAAPGPPLLASVGDDVDGNEVNLSRQAFQASISRDGRFIAFTHVLTGQPVPTEVVLHDRDADADGTFDELGPGQTSTVIDPGPLAPFSTLGADQPAVSADGAFVAFRAHDLIAPSSTGVVRVWRRSDDTTFDATAGVFTGGTAGTRATWPAIDADGTTVAYDFEIFDDSIVSDIPFGRNQTVVVEVDPGAGTISNPYIASQDPTNADPTTAISDSTRPSFPSLSDDGRYVIYESNADNVAGHIGGGSGQIYAVDLRQVAPVDRVPVLVTTTPSGTPATQGSFAATVSGDASTVAFASNDETLTFDTEDDTPNAFTMRWQVDVAAESLLVFPDTAVGATSAPLTLTFDTDDFGPWTAASTELLDAYVDPEVHDFDLVGTCTGVAFHANDPCQLQISFAPKQVGARVGEVCVDVQYGFFTSCATATFGGQALMPDAIGPIVRESLTGDDQQIVGGEGGPTSDDPAISADGRYVAFETDAALDPTDQNDSDDVYVRDRLRGTTTLVSSGAGTGPNEFDPSDDPTISADGRFIAFESFANHADEPDNEDDGGFDDIYLVDRGAPDPLTGDFVPGAETFTLVSLDTAGNGIFDDAADPSISGDGTQIAFTVLGGEGGSDVFIRDLTAPNGPVTIAPPFAAALEVTDTFSPAMSADGEHVALVANTRIGTAGAPLAVIPIRSFVVHVYDRDVDGDNIRDEAGASQTVQVSTPEFTPLAPAQGDTRFVPLEGTDSLNPAISGDGSTVAYSFRQSYDNHLDDAFEPEPIDVWDTALPHDTAQIVVLDRDAAGQPLPAEVASLAGPGDPNKSAFVNLAENAGQCLLGGEGCDSYAPDLSDDGRYVTFATEADNFPIQPAHSLPGHSFCGDGGACDIVAVDRDAPSNGGGPQHVNEPLFDVFDRDLDDDGFNDIFPDRQVGEPAISADGRFIVFDTGAEYLLGYEDVEIEPGLFETRPIDDNDGEDVYLREWQPVVDPSLPVVFPDTQIGATSSAQSAGASTQDFGPAPILGVELTGANPGDFLIVDSLNCLPPLPGAPPPVAGVPAVPTHGRVQLANGCSVFVAFRPTVAGARNAILRVTTGHPFSVPGTAAQVLDIPLSGGGAAPPGQPGFGSQGTFDFGSQIVTTTSPEIAIPITNTGDAPFQITEITIGGTNPGDFTIVGTDCIGFLAPGASCTVRVTFTPTAPGERSAVLVFTDTAPGGPHAIGLAGRAPLPTLILNPGVIVPGRTVQLIGANWAPNQVITITTADANNPTVILPGSTQITANAFGGLDGSLLFFPKTASGPRIVIATGTPPALTAFQPLLISVATVSGVDFVSRG